MKSLINPFSVLRHLDLWSVAAFESDGGGGGNDNDNDSSPSPTPTPARTQADVQSEINAALDASGGAWTSELNGLVAERNDIVDSGGGGGGTSNADAMREYASSMTAAGQTSLSGANPRTVAPVSSNDDDTPAIQPASSSGNAVTNFLNTYVLGENTQIGGDDTPAETNAERVTRESIEALVNSGQITPAQANDPTTSSAVVDLLNNTGVSSDGSNPLQSNTMGIGSDGRLLDAVTGATDAGVLVGGTPTVEVPTVETSSGDDGRTDATIGSLIGSGLDKVEDFSKTVSDAVTPYLPEFVQDFRQPYVDEANTRIAARDLPPVTDQTFIGPMLPGTTIDTVGTNLPVIERDFFEQAVGTAGNQLYTLLGGATRGLAETFDPTATEMLQMQGPMLPGQERPAAIEVATEAPNFLSQVGANTAAAGRTSTQNLLEDDTTGLGARYTGGVTEVTGDKAGGIFNPLNYSRPIDPETGEPISYEDSIKNLGTKALVTGIQAIPILASLPYSASAAILTGMGYGIGEVVNDADAELAAQRAAGALTNADGTPISDAQYEALRSDVAQNATALGSVTGAIETTLLPGFGRGIISRSLTGAGSGMLTEAAQIESANLASSSAMTPGTAAYEAGRTQNADELLTAAIVGGTAPVFTPPMSTTTTTTQGGPAASGIQTLGTGPAGTGGTGLTAAQRTALSDTTGIAGTSVAPTVSTVAPAQPGTSVDAANTMAVDPFFSEGVVLDPQNVVTPPVAPTQPSTNQDVIDAVFTDIPSQPNVTTTAPAQLAAPDSSVASGVISGTPTTTTAPTTQVVPQLPAPAAVDTTPFVDISAIAPPNVTTNIDQITIPGTNITVDVPSLQTPTTDSAVNTAQPSGLAALGTGGAFNPNVSNLPASVTASPIAQPVTETAATDAVSQEQSIIDTIAQEVAQEGGLTIETAQEIAAANNLSVQEVANLAETAMGVEPSTATGPSTSLVPASSVALDAFGGPGTNIVPANTANTGIATLDPNQTDVGGLEGQIIDPDNAVVTRDTGPAIEGPTIEGTVNSMEVDAANTVATEPFVYDGQVLNDPNAVATEVIVDPVTTIDGTVNTNTVVPINPVNVPRGPVVVVPTDPVTTTTTEVVPQTQLVPSSYDPIEDDDITVEVDEPVVVDDDEDVVVEIDPPIDFDDDDDVAVEEDAPFECPDGFEAVQVNGVWRCQSTDDMPEKVRPTAGAYYRPNPNPNYGAAARRRRA